MARDHWLELAVATRWSRVGELLVDADPVGSRMAWSRAATAFAAYCAAYDANMPASRFDYDYRAEARDAKDRAGSRAATNFAVAPRGERSELLQLALEGRFADASALVTARPRRRVERSVLGILALELGIPSKEPLWAWSSEETLAAIAARVAEGASRATGDPLSHLDYPTGDKNPPCVVVGFVRAGLFRGLALFRESTPLRAVYVASAAGTCTALDLDDDDPAPVVDAVARYLGAIGDAAPPLDLVNVACDLLEVFHGRLEVKGLVWMPRVVPGEPPRAYLDLVGAEPYAWPGLVSLAPEAAAPREPQGVSASVAGDAAPIVLASTEDLLAQAPGLLVRAREAIVARAARSGSR